MTFKKGISFDSNGEFIFVIFVTTKTKFPNANKTLSKKWL